MMATAYSHGSGNWVCGLGFCSGGSPPDGGQPGRLGSAQHESAWWFVGSSGDGPGAREARHHRERTENDELSFYIGGHTHPRRRAPFGRVLFGDAARSPDSPSGGGSSSASVAFRFPRAAISSVRVQSLRLPSAGLSRVATLNGLRADAVKTATPARAGRKTCSP